MKSLGIAVLLTFILLVFLNPVMADSLVLEEPAVKKVTPGNFVTLVFPLKYYGQEDTIVDAEFNLPEGWSLLSPISTYSVKTNENNPIFITVKIPSDALAKSYDVILAIKDQGGKKIEQTAVVEVLPHIVIKLMNLTETVQVHQNESVELYYRFINIGNVPAELTLNPEFPEDWLLKEIQSPLLIEPGAYKEVSIVLRPPTEFAAGSYDVLLNVGIKGASKIILSTANILPPYPDQVKGTLWWKVPGNIDFYCNWGTDMPFSAGGSVILAGSLPKDRWMTFVWEQELDGDWNYPTLTVGERDEWFVRGGRVKQGSDLTAIDGLGFQAGKKITPVFSIKGALIYDNNKWGQAAEGQWKLKPSCIVRVGFINSSSLLGYSSVTTYPDPDWKVNAEAAVDFNADSYAWKLNNELSKGKWLWTAGVERINEDYLEQDGSAGLFLSTRRKVEKTDFSARFEQGYAEDVSKRLKLMEQEISAGLGWNINSRNKLHLDGSKNLAVQEDDDILFLRELGISLSGSPTQNLRYNLGKRREYGEFDVSYNTAERESWEAGLGGFLGNIDWQTNYSWSESSGDPGVFENLGLSREWRVHVGADISDAYLWWERTETEIEWEDPNYDIANEYGAMVPFTLKEDKLYSTLGYEYVSHTSAADERTLSGNLNYRFNRDANMTFGANRSEEIGNEPNWRYNFGINSNVDMPLYGIKKMGRIEGHIFIDDNKNGEYDEGEEGVKDLLIISNTGEQALSGETGFFRFPPMLPDKYQLLVRDVPMGYALDWEGSIEVEVPKGIVSVDIPVHRECILRLDCFLDSNGDGIRQPEEEGIPGISFIVNGEEFNGTFRSAANGTISIGAPRGLYTIAVVRNTLPKWHELSEGFEFKVEGNIDKRTEINIPVKKVERKLNVTVVAPFTDFTFEPITIYTGEKVVFDASNTVSMNGSIKLYQWNFGTPEVFETNKPVIEHTFTEPGRYLIQLTALDTVGGEGVKAKWIVVEGASVEEDSITHTKSKDETSKNPVDEDQQATAEEEKDQVTTENQMTEAQAQPDKDLSKAKDKITLEAEANVEPEAAVLDSEPEVLNTPEGFENRLHQITDQILKLDLVKNQILYNDTAVTFEPNYPIIEEQIWLPLGETFDLFSERTFWRDEEQTLYAVGINGETNMYLNVETGETRVGQNPYDVTEQLRKENYYPYISLEGLECFGIYSRVFEDVVYIYTLDVHTAEVYEALAAPSGG